MRPSWAGSPQRRQPAFGCPSGRSFDYLLCEVSGHGAQRFCAALAVGAPEGAEDPAETVEQVAERGGVAVIDNIRQLRYPARQRAASRWGVGVGSLDVPIHLG